MGEHNGGCALPGHLDVVALLNIHAISLQGGTGKRVEPDFKTIDCRLRAWFAAHGQPRGFI
jgi:hypothetical protein